MKIKPADIWRGAIRHTPEGLLGIFLISLSPMVVMGAGAMWGRLSVLFGSSSSFRTVISQQPWPLAATVMCLIGTAALVLVMWRNWGFVWAVARKMIVEALHRRIVLVLLVFFIVLMLSLPFILKTEGSLKSQVQLVLLYSTVLAMVLLSLVAIFLSAASICSEIDGKQIQITDTKPMRRWQFLLGKWFGVVVLCTAVMFAMTAVACGLVLSIARPPDVLMMTPQEAAKAEADYLAVMGEVLVARRTVRALPPPNMDEAVQDLLASRGEEVEIPEKPLARERMMTELRKAALTKALTAEPGGVVHFEFAGLSPENDNVLYVRFYGFTNIARRMVGRWVAWSWKTVLDEEGKESRARQMIWVREAPEFGWQTDALREFVMPATFKTNSGEVRRLVPEDGAMFLSYENLDGRVSISFHGERRVEIMQAEGGFLANYYRGLLIILCHIALLAALGLMAGSIFSFPVASLTVVFFFIVGLVGPWFLSFTEGKVFTETTVMDEVIYVAWRGFARGMMAIMPHFGSYSPLGDLTDGKMVDWSRVAYAGAMMIYLKALVAMLVGMYFYARRELARVIV